MKIHRLTIMMTSLLVYVEQGLPFKRWLFLCAMLGFEPRAFSMLSKCLITEPHSQGTFVYSDFLSGAEARAFTFQLTIESLKLN